MNKFLLLIFLSLLSLKSFAEGNLVLSCKGEHDGEKLELQLFEEDDDEFYFLFNDDEEEIIAVYNEFDDTKYAQEFRFQDGILRLSTSSENGVREAVLVLDVPAMVEMTCQDAQ